MRSGQALLEYVLAFAAVAVLVSVLWTFVDAAAGQAVRTERIVTSEYP